MSKVVLKTENLGISFGGLKAVQKLNLEIKVISKRTHSIIDMPAIIL